MTYADAIALADREARRLTAEMGKLYDRGQWEDWRDARIRRDAAKDLSSKLRGAIPYEG